MWLCRKSFLFSSQCFDDFISATHDLTWLPPYQQNYFNVFILFFVDRCWKRYSGNRQQFKVPWERWQSETREQRARVPMKNYSKYCSWNLISRLVKSLFSLKVLRANWIKSETSTVLGICVGKFDGNSFIPSLHFLNLIIAPAQLFWLKLLRCLRNLSAFVWLQLQFN